VPLLLLLLLTLLVNAIKLVVAKQSSPSACSLHTPGCACRALAAAAALQIIPSVNSNM
jgi:hypothetical protein